MTEEEINEAAASALVSTGGSAFIHGIDTDVDVFKEELAAMVAHIKAHAESG